MGLESAEGMPQRVEMGEVGEGNEMCSMQCSHADVGGDGSDARGCAGGVCLSNDSELPVDPTSLTSTSRWKAWVSKALQDRVTDGSCRPSADSFGLSLKGWSKGAGW